ncbi:MAG: hypothetical protein AAGA36_00305 [Pseudomonadota bacterium]
MTKRPHRALNVPCPTCHAKRGEPCRIRRTHGAGRPKHARTIHPARRELARQKFVQEKTLRAQILPLLGGDKSEARALASEIVAFEARQSLKPRRPAAQQRNQSTADSPPSAGAVQASPPTPALKRREAPPEVVTDEVLYRVRRFVILSERYRRQRKRQLGRALQSQYERKSDYAFTPETRAKLGLKKTRLSQRSRSSTLTQLFAMGAITGDELEACAEIVEAHRLLTNELHPRGTDPSKQSSGGSGRFVLNDTTTRELVLEDSYRMLRIVLGEKLPGMTLIRDLLIFETPLRKVVSAWEAMRAKVPAERWLMPEKTSEEEMLATLRRNLEVWQRIMRKNSEPIKARKLLMENEEFFALK